MAAMSRPGMHVYVDDMGAAQWLLKILYRRSIAAIKNTNGLITVAVSEISRGAAISSLADTLFG